MKGGKLRHRTNKNFRWQERHCPAHAGLKGDEWFRRLLEESIAKLDTAGPLSEAQVLQVSQRKRRPRS